MIALDVAAMRALDARESAARGATTLMRDAGEAIAALVPRYAGGRRIAGVAGPGNNGGDVFATLAALPSEYEGIVFALSARDESDARKDAVARAREAGVEIRPIGGAADLRGLADADLILDGVLGVGARLPLASPFEEVAGGINAAGPPVLAIDLPSGTDASDGRADPHAVRAVATITIGALKLGLLLDPARESTGELWLAPIGFPAAYEGVVARVLDDAEFRALVPQRGATADKRRAGAPLIVAGSEQFPGAAVLCAWAAARAGAGYVTIAAPERAAPAIRAHLVEQVVVTYDETDPQKAIARIAELANHCSSLAIGPGLGLSDAMGTIVREVIRDSALPIVVDASGLFHLAKHLDVLHRKRAVITPHEGEFARLSGKGTFKEEERLLRLRAFVDEHQVITLLKGRATLVYDGLELHVNPTGTQVLATAGTGDVLTGIIATLLAQGVTPVDAARAGAYWHGVAGRLAGEDRALGVVAGDLPDYFAAAYLERSERQNTPQLVRIV